jgi:hypothetical protein
MSDIVVTINNRTQPIPIRYVKTQHGFSDPNNETTRYLFELIINGETIGKKYFRNLEENKYSHMIRLPHKIKLTDIRSYKACVSIHPSDLPLSYELEGQINQFESSSTQRSDNIYIEFTKNDMGYAMCSCFYIGLDQNKIFASPPN